MRERPDDAPVLPLGLADLVAGRVWWRNTVGEAGCCVHRLHAPTGPDLYLKQASGPQAGDLVDEVARLCWLTGHLPVPAIRYFAATPDQAWLLTDALPGRTAGQMLEDNPADATAIVDALARFLARLHAIPVATCPFNSDHHLRLGHARTRLEAGLVDEDDFGDEHAGWSAQRVWDAMVALLPLTADPVVTHGDYSLDNILIDHGEVVGCIDVGRVGIADRYQDLAILLDCLDPFDPALRRHFLKTYGITDPDEAKLRFHRLLDEFF